MERPSDMPDAEAVRRALAGDKEAFVVLLRRHQESVYGLCRRILSSDSEAQDIAQEAALRAFLGLGMLREPERFGAWLHSIAANLARYRLRQRRGKPLLSLESYAGDPADRLLVDAGLGPEDVRLARELHDEVLGAIEELSDINREVVVGYYLQGYSYAELAELLGVPVSTIKGRLYKGRKQLEPSLEPVARQVLGISGKENTMNGEPLIEVAVEDALKMSLDTEDALELLRNSGSLRDLTGLMEKQMHDSVVPSVAILLKEDGGQRVLPIWVGLSEGLSIWNSVSGRETPRPMTHDLMSNLLAAANLAVESVAVVRLAEQTFYGEITLNQRNGASSTQHRIDARPSDAIALAVRLEAPIYVARPVLDEAAFESKEALLTAQREGTGLFEK